MCPETDDDLAIAHVPEDDEETRSRLEDVASAAFPTPQDLFVDMTEHVLAARVDGEVVGGVVLDVVDGSGGPVGIVTWLFTSPDAQGRGVGGRLVEEAIEYLRAEGCRAAVAVVKWSNTPSSKLFARREFERTSSLAVVRRYGTRQGGLVLARSFHLVGVSCDLWVRRFSDGAAPTATSVRSDATAADVPAEPRVDRSTARSAGRFGETLVVHALLLAVVVGGLSVLTWDRTTLLLGGVAALLIGLRWLPYFVSTALDDRRWGFWSWGNVYPFAGVIALFDGFLPVPGHVAPEQRVWSYREALPVLGPAATTWAGLLVGGLAVLPGLQGQLDDAIWRSLRVTLTVFVVVDLWLVVWPFEGYNGRVVYDWNRAVWVALSAGAALALGVVYLG